MGSDRPYFWFTYEYSDDYYLPYNPARYNTTNELVNFQNSMNCYAYALQSYHVGNGYYPLYPGEIGIGQTGNDDKTAYNWKQLESYYSYASNPFENAAEDYNDHSKDDKSYYLKLINSANNYAYFVENQMRRDAKAMNFTITKYDSTPDLINSVIRGHILGDKIYNKFILPSTYNEDNERFIMMICYVVPEAYNGYTASFHYYLRNGNGTCSNPDHDEHCSIWTHKMGDGEVSDKSIGSGVTLCDFTVYNEAYNIASSGYHRPIYYNPDLINIYGITKDTNPYNYSFNGIQN